jgi:hypothetical protein
LEPASKIHSLRANPSLGEAYVRALNNLRFRDLLN